MGAASEEACAEGKLKMEQLPPGPHGGRNTSTASEDGFGSMAQAGLSQAGQEQDEENRRCAPGVPVLALLRLPMSSKAPSDLEQDKDSF